DRLLKAGNAYWAVVVKAQHQVAAGWVAHTQGRKDDALKLMQSAASLEYSAQTHDTLNPGPIGMTAHEALGELLLDSRRAPEALKAYETSLKHAPNRFNALVGAARAADQAGDKDKARKYYAALVALTEKASADRPEIGEARKHVAGR
ncbi:MAG TPA: tetratricopeptide repeat protein, partial [Solirubrobacterales bacterium]|nr:tetratricopeptide repeat protein [Solirubrobacterales bacterium]